MPSSRRRRPIKDNTFLDDPSAYPEFAELTSKLPSLHALRCGFHAHRTSVLLLLVAVSVTLSGVPVPPAGAGASRWVSFCMSAMAVDRLSAHFQGFGTAFAVMMVTGILSVVVHPLHRIMTGGSVKTGSTTTTTTAGAATIARSPFVTRIVSLGLPATALWGVAIWAKSRYAWGLASGLWVGLFCACSTLKMTSFTATASAGVVTPIKQGSQVAEGRPSTATSSDSTGHAGGEVPSPQQQGLVAQVDHDLNFSEYIYFLFLTPSLVCEAHLMKRSARRSSRPLRAASELFHAVLAFLAVHCVCSTIVAPSLRLFVTGLEPRWVHGADTEWAALESSSGSVSGWPPWSRGSELLMDEGKSPWMTLASGLWILTAVSSVMHFVVFYAFWHCVCLSIAELSGFPDRHLYGCWWLVFDDPRDFLRMWSVPVHRWLSACVHWPMLQAAAAVSATKNDDGDNNRISRSSADVGDDTRTEGIKDGHLKGERVVDGGNGKQIMPPTVAARSPSTTGWLAAVLATFIVSGVFHEAVVYVAMRGSCWPFNTFLLTVAGLLILLWDRVFPVRQDDTHRVHVSSGSAGSGRDGSNGVNGGSGAGKVKPVRAYGRRGMIAAVVFTILIQLSAFISDIVAWLWWRHVLM